MADNISTGILSGLYEKVYNPDVLSCLANLSNDEVFTPPEIVNKMLDMLPQELFSSPDTKFLDPAVKTGVYLREIAKRLIKGLEAVIPDRQQRIDHIFKNQLYGIAITELTSLLSRRSLYCSKYANSAFSVTHFENSDGNIRFKRIPHSFNKSGRCIFCGASETQYDRGEEREYYAYEWIHTLHPEEIFGMKFDVIISNPPYQLNDGGGTGSSSVPIYHEFVYKSLQLKPRYLSMIIPSRWYAGGKGLDDFRNNMLNSSKISTIVDFANSADCFPGVTIAGGICYFLWGLEYNGECKIINMNAGEEISSSIRKLNEYPVFVRNNIAIQIIRKVNKVTKNYLDMIVHSRNCFNLFSKEIGHNEYKKEDCVLYSLNGKSYITKNEISDRDNLLNKYKVIMTKAMSGGNKPSNDGSYLVISSTMRVLKPNEVCTETYLCIGSFENETEANNLCDYMKTKFFRFLLLQALTSINISKDKFLFVPLQDFSKLWTDSELYEKYNLTDEEINFIESMIRPMDLGGENNG